MVKEHLERTLNAIVLGATNTRTQAINAKIQWLRYTARGFRNRRRFRAAIYFYLAGLDLYPGTLPARTYPHKVLRSQFRQLMERDMEIRGFSPHTQQCYLGCFKDFVRYLMSPPDQLTIEDIHRYQLHLAPDRRVSWGVFNQAVAALRFFYGVTLLKD